MNNICSNLKIQFKKHPFDHECNKWVLFDVNERVKRLPENVFAAFATLCFREDFSWIFAYHTKF